MKLPPDFRDVLVCLSDARAEFLLIGGFAVAHHGHVRATKDIDLFVRATEQNAARVSQALEAFGAPLAALGVTAADFTVVGRVVQLGVPPLRINLVTGISGLDFDQAAVAAGVVDVEGEDPGHRPGRAAEELACVGPTAGCRRRGGPGETATRVKRRRLR